MSLGAAEANAEPLREAEGIAAIFEIFDIYPIDAGEFPQPIELRAAGTQEEVTAGRETEAKEVQFKVTQEAEIQKSPSSTSSTLASLSSVLDISPIDRRQAQQKPHVIYRRPIEGKCNGGMVVGRLKRDLQAAITT
ncbi:hypothetical protein HRR83_000814 [Exophiala dermatitidis]|uniref:Uncharacterized protein n=1 Tax=Exophiala dermatitidis TaxID=5970 RepID=A0AAN6F2K6_EXODE|nr:hypothetical protein HRR75_000738 [Exophiala dermatitidis]KAJ4528063.1 hypothetical protein HRR74_000818 [Exophiala dermatitidis]KAJ4528696.1 hypothetical protein HRR73_001319 [Exophiala dermatitidis]KAJ4530077.1 hypothetical protein HRR76_009315 [Exophiala dermatitidis]KAJ4553035.1 hypothetical protein HRR78_003294 [Exophiala dermatitidis]